MKTLIYLLGFGSLLLFSCSDEIDEQPSQTKTETKVETEEDLIERMPGMYREYYPGKKQLKMAGPVDTENKRHGSWESYFENGQINSATYYLHGIKNGHSIVYYPNGKVHYYGEYKNDEKIGTWITYNEKGEQIAEDNF